MIPFTTPAPTPEERAAVLAALEHTVELADRYNDLRDNATDPKVELVRGFIEGIKQKEGIGVIQS